MRVCPECFRLYGPDRDECERDGAKLSHYTRVLIGLRLGPYIIRSMANEGGMGVVYVAEHPALGRRVAIKVLRPELSFRDDIVERFTQEARAVNTIAHANIVKIYDFGKTPFGSFYIVMEYLDGLTIRSLLDDTGPQPLERIRFIIKEVAVALGAAHSKGFVHRDVKPANIMVCQRAGVEFIKLLDFGIAKLVTSSEQTTDQGIALGTPQYMAPEQLDNNAADPRTDIYALGVVAYELLTGQVPYPGNSQAAVRHAQTTYRPQPPSQCRRDIRLAASIDRVVFQSIAPSPDDRYQSVDALMEAFDQAHQDTLKQLSAAQPAARSPARRRWLLVAAVAGSAVAIVLGAMMLRRSATAPPQGPARHSTTVRDQRPADIKGAAKHLASPAKGSPDPSQVVDRALRGADRLRRRSVLKQILEVRPERLRPQLIRALGDEDSIARRVAALALGRLEKRDPETLRALRAALPQQMSFAAIAFAQALAQLGDDTGVLRLRRELVLARRRGPRAVRFALEALADHDVAAARRLDAFARTVEWADSPRVKARLLLKMAQAGIRQPRRDLQRALTEQPSETARLHAARALARIGDDQATPALRRLSRSSTGAIRTLAAQTLAGQGDVGAIESLLESLDSSEAADRASGALGLGSIGSRGEWSGELRERVRRGLTAALDDEDDAVSSAAAVALLAF